jgi:hypothetical protein
VIRRAGLALALALSALGCSQPVIYQMETLPDELALCGRLWERDVLNRLQSSAEIREDLDMEPAVVERLDVCPAGACTEVAQAGACHTVIYVRVGPDEYLDYSVLGGP